MKKKSTKLLNSLIKKVIKKIRFYQRFRFSESVKSAFNFDADKTDLLRKNADKNGFYLHFCHFDEGDSSDSEQTK